MAASSARCIALVTVLLAAACTGCNPAARLVGKWEADLGKAAQESGANPLAAMFAKSVKFSVEFKPNGELVTAGSFLGQSAEQKGTWRYVKSEADALVVALKVPPSGTEQEVRIRMVDGDHIAFKPPAGSGAAGGAELTLARVKP
jgi:hypothetical protein